MRIVITGGAGFIGSHLADYFIAGGHHVTVLDNLITGSLANIEHLFGNERFSFIKHDVTQFIHVPGPVDAVLHFASPASPVDYLKYPIQTLKVGALGTHKALGLAREKKAVFMLASTSEVYGDPTVSPQSETYWGNVNAVGPRGVYDEAKRFAEAMTMAYRRYHGLSTRIVRIFNTYGPRMRLNDGRVVPNFIGQALEGSPLTVYGRGHQTRSFCYVSDLVRGIAALLEKDIGDPINLGNPEELRIIDFAKLVLRLAGSRSRIVFRPLPQDDPRQRRPDIRRARTLLGWSPEVPLREGLERTIAYFKETRAAGTLRPGCRAARGSRRKTAVPMNGVRTIVGAAIAAVVSTVFVQAAPGLGQGTAAERRASPSSGFEDEHLLADEPPGHGAAADYTGLIISGVDIEGLRNVRPSAVKSAIKVRKGEPYDQDRINADFKALLDTGYFDDVTPVFDPATTTLVYRVVEKPQIRQVEFRGNVKVKSSKFKDDLPLKKDEWFDEVKLRDSISKILAKYDELGYSDTVVEHEQITDESNRMHLVFLIREGTRVTVGSKPAIRGAKFFSVNKVRSVMETKRKKVYRESTLREDLDRILTLYRNAGFYDVAIGTWTVVRDESRQSVEIAVTVYEGPRYRVRTVGVRGNTVFSDRQLMRSVVLRPGAVYNQRHVDESRMLIAEQYADRGYIKLRIEPDIVKYPADGLMDVVLAVTEGDLVYVDRIYVTGMKTTRENVIRREVLLREGDVFSTSRLRRSQERIMNLGFMDDVRVDLQPGGAEDRVDVEFTVVEGRPGMLSAGAGYSSVDQLVGNLQVSHMNLFGKAQRLKLLWEFGARRQNYDISWTEPWFLDRPTSLGVSLYDLVRVVEFDGDYNAYKKKQQGLEVKVGPRFGDKLGTLFSYGYENVIISDSRRDPSYDPTVPPERQVLNGAKLTSSISGQFIYDSRDNVFDPARGMRHSFSCQLAGWGPLGGDVRFYKPIVKSSIHIPTVWRLVLSLNLQFGYVEGIGGFDLNTVKYQKFYVGGPDTVRGYRYSEVNPSDGGRIMTVFNAEYKFPIVMEQRRTVLQGALFYDLGGAWNEWRDVTIAVEPGPSWAARSGWDNRMKQAVGFGLRFTTPVFPVRLDWAWPVTPREGDTYQFWFTIGQLF